MTGHRGYGGDGGDDVSVSSRYSDKEHMHSFRDDVGKGFLPCLVCAQACSLACARVRRVHCCCSALLGCCLPLNSDRFNPLPISLRGTQNPCVLRKSH